MTEKNTLLAKTEVLTNSAEFGIINQREFFDHDIVNENNIGGYYIVRERDFVYNPRISVSAPVGPINCNKLGKSGVMSPLYTVFRVHDIDSVYLEYFFKTSRWHSFMRFNGDSGVRSDRFSIKTELFYKMPIPITKYCEQVKIGKYFSQLDHLISLHQRKLEMLRKVKKLMLEKMFPKNDAKVPEVRFSDFTDAWEQRRLGEIGTLKNGMNFSKDAMGHGFPFVNLQDIFGKTIVDDKNLGKAEASTGQLRDYNLLSGDVLFVRSSVKLEGVGETALVLKDLNNTTYSGFIIRFRDESGIMNLFKRIIFTTGNVRRQIVSQATDSANKNISQVVLANLQINVPSSQEQKIVGSFFHYLDHLISLHQRKYFSIVMLNTIIQIIEIICLCCFSLFYGVDYNCELPIT